MEGRVQVRGKDLENWVGKRNQGRALGWEHHLCQGKRGREEKG